MISCHVLLSGYLLIAKEKRFSFYTADLERVQDFTQDEAGVNFLGSTYQFKHLTHSKSGSFVILADLNNKFLMSFANIKHSHTGPDNKGYHSFITELSVDEDQSRPQKWRFVMECKNI